MKVIIEVSLNQTAVGLRPHFMVHQAHVLVHSGPIWSTVDQFVFTVVQFGPLLSNPYAQYLFYYMTLQTYAILQEKKICPFAVLVYSNQLEPCLKTVCIRKPWSEDINGNLLKLKVVQFCPLWSKFGHLKFPLAQIYYLVQCGPIWSIVVQCGPMWSNVVQCGPMWSNIGHFAPINILFSYFLI